MSSVSVGYPLDTLKTRVQVGMHVSPLQSLRATVAKEGPLALYRGCAMPLMALMVKRPPEFAVFEWCNARFGKRAKGPVVGGFIAGIISAVLGCPFNVVKVQMQASQKETYRNVLHACSDVWHSDGAPGFYRGFSATLIMSVPSTTFYLGAYGILREWLPPSRWNTAFAGIVASGAMWSVLLPLDNVRTNIQAKPFGTNSPMAGWVAQAREIARGPKGALGLWAGWTAVIVRAPLMSAVSMLCYEHARTVADKWTSA